MNNLFKATFKVKMIKYYILVAVILFIFLVNIPISYSNELDLLAAQESVGKRFSSKYCEAKEEGLSSESASEFALNNTYLKFVDFPDDEKYIEDLWFFTIEKIRESCDSYVTKSEEFELRDFFKEESEIAINRELYLPNL